jgi:hypothetical protein
MITKVCKLALFLFGSINTASTAIAADITFVGIPVKASTMKAEYTIKGDKQEEYKLVITETEGRYYWTSRDNRELRKTTSGAFEIYTGVGGEGMIVVVAEWYKKGCKGERVNLCFEFDYGEHIRDGFTMISYYGFQTSGG